MGTLAPPAHSVLYEGTDRAGFLHARKDGLGASDVAAVLGFSKWSTPYDVWAEKTGRSPDREQTQAMEFGIALERVIADRFSVRHGHRDRPLPIGKVRPAPGVLRSVLFPWLLASPDRMIVEFDRDPALPLVPLEIKTANAFIASDWAHGATPVYYQAQSQAQQLVLYGSDALSDLLDFPAHGWLVPLIGGNDMPDPRRLGFDRVFAEEHLIPETERFWVENVEKDVAPPLTLADDVNAHFPALRGATVVASPAVEALVAERRALSVRMSADGKQDEHLKQQIRLAMLEATALLSESGEVLVTWDLPKAPAKVSSVVDLAALTAGYPDIAAEFTSEVRAAQSRTMRFPKPKGADL